MSENLEDLLGSVDEENEDDYDLADDEENALLEGNYESKLPTKLQPSSKDINVESRVEQDILELDDEIELNDDEIELNDDEDNEVLNSTVEEEEDRSRNDKFANERVRSQDNPQLKETNEQNFKSINHNARSNFRGRGRTRGNYRNYVRSVQPRKKVHINPHFQGNVQIKNNVSLAWDNNRNVQHKKPFMYIQPLAQNSSINNHILPPPPQHQQQAPFLQDIYNLPFQQSSLQQVNTRVPVHQRLGVNQYNNYNNIPENPPQFIQNVQQPALFEPPPPLLNNPYCNLNQLNRTTYQPNLSINQPPPYNNQCLFSNQVPGNFNSNVGYPFVPPVQAQQSPQVFSPQYNDYIQHPNDFQNNVPVANTVSLNYPYVDNKKPIQNTNDNNNRWFLQVSPGKRTFDNFKGDLKKKKRSFSSTNLHEVLTVDTPTFNEERVPPMLEEEDEEMRAYRLKIEHQKKIREKILRQKEERRKQAAKKLQAEEEYKSVVPPNELIKHEEIPVITGVNVESKNKILQKKATMAHINKNIVPIKTVSDTQIVRIVNVNPLKNNISVNEPNESFNKDQLSSFLSNRKIFAKDQTLSDTSVVVINNLATGTSELKLRKLCQGVGDIQVRVDKGKRTVS